MHLRILCQPVCIAISLKAHMYEGDTIVQDDPIPYNHSRGDSKLTPCPICKEMQESVTVARTNSAPAVGQLVTLDGKTYLVKEVVDLTTLTIHGVPWWKRLWRWCWWKIHKGMCFIGRHDYQYIGDGFERCKHCNSKQHWIY